MHTPDVTASHIAHAVRVTGCSHLSKAASTAGLQKQAGAAGITCMLWTGCAGLLIWALASANPGKPAQQAFGLRIFMSSNSIGPFGGDKHLE